MIFRIHWYVEASQKNSAKNSIAEIEAINRDCAVVLVKNSIAQIHNINADDVRIKSLSFQTIATVQHG